MFRRYRIWNDKDKKWETTKFAISPSGNIINLKTFQEVDPEIYIPVSCIEHKDMTGELLYENDIINRIDDEGSSDNALIELDCTGIIAGIYDIGDSTYMPSDDIMDYQSRVVLKVGNINENPDLMPLCLYWVTTPDGDEDWFIIERTPMLAGKLHEGYEGYGDWYADAKKIMEIPKDIKVDIGWPDREIMIKLGAKYLHEESPRLVKIGGSEYLEGRLESMIEAYRKRMSDFPKLGPTLNSMEKN